MHIVPTAFKAKSFLLLLFSFFALCAVTADAHAKNVGHAEGRILVKPREGLESSKFAAILQKRNAKAADKINKAGVYIVKVPPGLEKKIVAELKSESLLEFAELDELMEPSFVPNDPSFGNQWHHAKIGTAMAWDGAQANSIVIAILDSGVHSNHPDLAASMLPGWNVVSQNTDSSDVQGHGTLVAGTAAAVANNAIGVAGVARGARILPVRITNDPAGYAYWSDVTKGVTWAADHGAKVVNNSYSSHVSSSVLSAANYLRSKGGLMVTSAGNDSAALTHPDNNIIVAGATTSADARASWSNTGPMVDISAPGAGILTTTRSGGYANASGTSFAAPNTAGLIALIMGANPALAPNDVEMVLESTALDLGTAGYDMAFGHGRINAAAAIQAAVAFIPTTPEPTPEPTPAPSPNDTTPPTVSIKTPINGSRVSGTVNISVIGNDNVAVSSIVVTIDGKVAKSVTGGSLSFGWNTRKVATGGHVIVATAKDAAGNTAVAQITVQK